MINFKTISSNLLEANHSLAEENPHELIQKLNHHYSHKFLFESKDISSVYGRLSLIGVDPVIQIKGKNEDFSIKLLHSRGEMFFDLLKDSDFEFCDEIMISETEIRGRVLKDTNSFEESKRSKRKNIAQIIRQTLELFRIEERSLLGLYGALSYDFIRLFEDIKEMTPENKTDDFNFFIYDTFIFFDHLKQKSEITLYRKNTQEAEKDIQILKEQISNEDQTKIQDYEISNPEFALSKEEYEEMVETAKEYARKGEIFEVVFSNILKAKFGGDPLSLYLKYRDINPSPYLFFFDFGDQQLVGASPEMMVRCEKGRVNLRPISGTAKRGKDPIEDHENMLELLADPKERAELDMLIDLGRNDLSRVCKPGIEISDYRFVEKYSNVMHTVAHLEGELQEGNEALDALIACLNAGTLTGAPKVAAMQLIEKHEKEKRGYYGGSIGYFTFSGDMDTGIIIRTAHIKDSSLRFQVGATLLFDSDPSKEHQETINKASAFLKTFSNDYSHEI